MKTILNLEFDPAIPTDLLKLHEILAVLADKPNELPVHITKLVDYKAVWEVCSVEVLSLACWVVYGERIVANQYRAYFINLIEFDGTLSNRGISSRVGRATVLGNTHNLELMTVRKNHRKDAAGEKEVCISIESANALIDVIKSSNCSAAEFLRAYATSNEASLHILNFGEHK
jgi:hypothetical protein